MKNGWTGGQYSLLRALLGAALAVYFAALLVGGELDFTRFPLSLIPGGDESALLQKAVAIIALAAAALLALGQWDRPAAWFLFFAIPWPKPDLLSIAFIPPLHFALVIHFLTPKAPYGSLAARGRQDPGGDWRFPERLFASLWLFLGAAALAAGIAMALAPEWREGARLAAALAERADALPFLGRLIAQWPPAALTAFAWTIIALHLLFAPLALSARWRPRVWLALLIAQIALGLTAAPAFGWSMAFLLLLAFDPRWLPPTPRQPTPIVFYDGGCGLCHRAVRMILAEDREGRIRVAPLQGSTFEETIPADRRRGLPDSVVVAIGETLYVEARATQAVGRALGGWWRLLTAVSRALPTPLLNGGYRLIARVRLKLFAQPKDVCPILPQRLRDRFLP